VVFITKNEYTESVLNKIAGPLLIKNKSKIELYSSMSKRLSDNQLLDVFYEIESGFYKLMEDESIYRYFKKERGLEIHSKKDLELFQYILGEEIRLRNGTIREKFNNIYQGRRVLEELVGTINTWKKINKNINQLDNFVKPLDELLGELYVFIKNQEISKIGINSKLLPRIKFYGNILFETKNDHYVRIVSSSIEDIESFKKYQHSSNFIIDLRETKSILRKRIYINQDCIFGFNGSLEDFIEKLKTLILNDEKKEKDHYLKCLNTMFKLPIIYTRRLQKKSEKIQGDIGSILE